MNTNPPSEGAVFGVARQLQTEEARQEYLNQVCGDDAARRERILQLLSEDQCDSFLARPAVAAGATVDAAEREGQTVGPYKLLQQIGEGGFGIVYMAEQERPVRRKVALKSDQAGDGQQGSHRSLRGRTAGVGNDGPPKYRQCAGRRRY